MVLAQVRTAKFAGSTTRFRPAPGAKRLAYGARKEVRVVVLEKDGEGGAYILSGAVIEPSALDALLPDWRETGLSRVVAWLGGIAEELGAEVYAHFAGARLLLSDSPDLYERTGPHGLTRQRTTSARFEPGIAFRAPATLLAEGAHSSPSKSAIPHLRPDRTLRGPDVRAGAEAGVARATG
ncbi:hypothetical protein DFH09DRAFT_1338938 [Mycena vulgaris]|nr:hypothetical protein DFH09DRAFT_1338938 [Mycena vulgaris]